MQGLVRPVGYLALVVLAAAEVAVVVALVFDLDAVDTISVAFIGVGLALGAVAFYTAPGPPAPDVPGAAIGLLG